MDKIQKLIELAYNTGYHSCRLAHSDGMSANDIVSLRERQNRDISERNKLTSEIRASINLLQEAAEKYAEAYSLPLEQLDERINAAYEALNVP